MARWYVIKHSPCGVLVVLLAWICCAPLTCLLTPASLSVSAQICPSSSSGEGNGDPASLDTLLEPRGQGTLGPFLSSAESIRQVILDRELPYAAIREEIRRR